MKGEKEEEAVVVSYTKNSAIDFEGEYPEMYMNKMALEFFGAERCFYLNPVLYNNWLVGQKHGNPSFPTTVFVKFDNAFLANMSGEDVANLFVEYGDFYCHKADETSCYLEFSDVNEEVVGDKKYTTFMEMIKARGDLPILETTMHREAPIFMAQKQMDNK